MADFTIKRGDREPGLVLTLEHNGAPYAIPGGATAKLLMKLPGAGSPKVNAAVVIDADQGANPGRVTYAWGATDTDTEGTFNIEVEVSYAGGEKATFPNDGYKTIEIVEDLG